MSVDELYEETIACLAMVRLATEHRQVDELRRRAEHLTMLAKALQAGPFVEPTATRWRALAR